MGKKIEDCLEFGAITGALSTTEAGGTKAFQDKSKLKETALEQFHYIL